MIPRKTLLILLAMFLAVVMSLGAFFLANKQFVATSVLSNQANGIGTSTPSRNGEYTELTFPDNTLDISDWQTYRNEDFGFEVKYPKGWGITKKTKQQLLEENPSAAYEPSYQGKIILDPHSDPYSFITFDIYFESVDQIIEKREEASLGSPIYFVRPPRRIAKINGVKVLYYTTSDTKALDKSPFLVFLGNTNISYEVHNTLSGFFGVFEKILLSFKLTK